MLASWKQPRVRAERAARRSAVRCLPATPFTDDPGSGDGAGAPPTPGGHAHSTFWALSKDSLPIARDPETLRPGPSDLGGAVTQIFTAHPKIDSANGEMTCCRSPVTSTG
jgi:carotenoid cleavage dioxygenase-like enzyme